MRGWRWAPAAPVVRELAALVDHYRRRRVDGGTVLAWIDDEWTRGTLRRAGDGPSQWLVPAVRAALGAARAGRLSDAEARAAVGALLPEYRLRRDLAG